MRGAAGRLKSGFEALCVSSHGLLHDKNRKPGHRIACWSYIRLISFPAGQHARRWGALAAITHVDCTCPDKHMHRDTSPSMHLTRQPASHMHPSSNVHAALSNMHSRPHPPAILLAGVWHQQDRQGPCVQCSYARGPGATPHTS